MTIIGIISADLRVTASSQTITGMMACDEGV
jgi:hypothetical protein